jgi:hypothetical protein
MRDDWPVDPLDPLLALKIPVVTFRLSHSRAVIIINEMQIRSGDPLDPNIYASHNNTYIGRVNGLSGLTRDEPLNCMTIRAASFDVWMRWLGRWRLGNLRMLWC